jgi:hypothetical protein
MLADWGMPTAMLKFGLLTSVDQATHWPSGDQAGVLSLANRVSEITVSIIAWPVPSRVHRIDVTVAAAAGLEGNLLAVRGPVRKRIRGGIAGQVDLSGAVRIHLPDVRIAASVAVEGDLGPVGRPGGEAVVTRIGRESRWRDRPI